MLRNGPWIILSRDYKSNMDFPSPSSCQYLYDFAIYVSCTFLCPTVKLSKCIIFLPLGCGLYLTSKSKQLRFISLYRGSDAHTVCCQDNLRRIWFNKLFQKLRLYWAERHQGRHNDLTLSQMYKSTRSFTVNAMVWSGHCDLARQPRCNLPCQSPICMAIRIISSNVLQNLVALCQKARWYT
jgi:hypothetical protein